MLVEPKVKAAYDANGTRPSPGTHRASVKNQLNRSIVDTIEISGKKGKPSEAPGALHGKTVDRVDLSRTFSVEDVNHLLVTEVGRKIEKMFEEAGIDPVAIADTDWSPEATAERIFRGTTGLFEIWKAQHKDMSEAELIDSFEQVLRSSVDQGAQEAIGLIEARKFEDEENIVGTAKETMGLVHAKFDDYFTALRERLNGEGETTDTTQTKDSGSSEGEASERQTE
ncbi:MAG: DUF5610 domain-containing protein [Deltaproteobacteria bacterium]|nr:DUF5610 domain-containing protein [Deltaproteobacteria bacterium]